MSADDASSGRAAKRGVARLRYRSQDYALGPGQYVIGRAPGCFLVLDEPLISRRHAELNVGHDSATVRDLDSVNGVFVNGRQISGPHMLAHGDRITIGKQDIEFLYGTDVPVSQPRPAFSAPKPPSSRRSFGVEAETTKQADALELIGIVADKALEAGRTEQAEEMLRIHLKHVIEGARKQRPMTNETALGGVQNSLKLAAATGKGSWVDYASELLHLKAIPCSEQIAELLRQAVSNADRVKSQQLEAYVRSQRSQASGLDRLRVSQKLEEVLRIAKTKRNMDV